MNNPAITRWPRPDDADPAQDARARAWAYAFSVYHRKKKEAAGPRQADDPKDAKKGPKNDSRQCEYKG